MAVCPDASFVLAWFLPTQGSRAASDIWRQLLRRGERLTAPPLLFAEVTSVLRRYVHSRILTHEEALAALRQLFLIPLSLAHDQAIYERALDLAGRLGHPKAYDAVYMAVADLEQCVLFTLDRGLYHSAQQMGIATRLIA